MKFDELVSLYEQEYNPDLDPNQLQLPPGTKPSTWKLGDPMPKAPPSPDEYLKNPGYHDQLEYNRLRDEMIQKTSSPYIWDKQPRKFWRLRKVPSRRKFRSWA